MLEPQTKEDGVSSGCSVPSGCLTSDDVSVRPNGRRHKAGGISSHLHPFPHFDRQDDIEFIQRATVDLQEAVVRGKAFQQRRIHLKQYEEISMTNSSIAAKTINHYSYLFGMLAFSASIVVVSYFILYELA